MFGPVWAWRHSFGFIWNAAIVVRLELGEQEVQKGFLNFKNPSSGPVPIDLRPEQLERLAQLLVEGQQAARVTGHQLFGRLDDGLADGRGVWAVAHLVFAGGLGQKDAP